MHWGQRRVSCYTGHTAPLHSLSKFSVSVFSISKVIHLPTQQKGRMVVFKDDEPLVEVLRACLAQGAPHKAVCCLPQLKTCGKAATESTDSVSQKRLAKHGLQSLCTFGMAVAGWDQLDAWKAHPHSIQL